MIKASIVAIILSLLSSSCLQTKTEAKIEPKIEIKEISLEITYSMFRNKNLYLIEKRNANSYDYFSRQYFSQDSIISEIHKTIDSIKFNQILNLINKLDETNLKGQTGVVMLGGDFHNLMFGNGINFKRYKIQSPFSFKRKNLEKYKDVIREIQNIEY